MRLRLLAVTVLLVAASACSSSPTSPSRHVALGQDFALKIGEAALVSDELLTVSFDGVTSDSRCPLGVLCIQAGEAVLRLGVARLSQEPQSLELHVGAGQAGEAKFQGYLLTAVELDPPRRQGGGVAPGDYVLTLEVTKP